MNASETTPHEKNAAIAKARREYFAALLHVAGSPAGKLVLERIRAAARVTSPCYTPGGSATDAVWRDGRKSIALEIDEDIRQAGIEFGSAEPAGKPKAVGKRASRRKGG